MSTPGGLPYPESTKDFNQGANDVKALALALDGRGHGKMVQSGQTAVTLVNSSGSFNFPAPFKAGTTPTVLAQGGAGSTDNNAMLAYAVTARSATGATVVATQIPGGAGAPSGWFPVGTVVKNVIWFAIGDAP